MLTRMCRVVFWVVLAAIFVLATTPGDMHPPQLFDWDKLNHGFAFTVLAFLLSYSYSERTLPWRDFGMLMAYGVLIEVVQYFMPGRSSSLQDLAADAVGVFVFYLLLPQLSRLPILREMKSP